MSQMRRVSNYSSSELLFRERHLMKFFGYLRSNKKSSKCRMRGREGKGKRRCIVRTARTIAPYDSLLLGLLDNSSNMYMYVYIRLYNYIILYIIKSRSVKDFMTEYESYIWILIVKVK